MEKLFITESDGKKREASLINCSSCGKEFLKANKHIKSTKSNKHYCSKECAYSGRKVERLELTCPFCGESFNRTEKRMRSKSGIYFCSRKCKDASQQIYNSEKTIFEILPPHYGTAGQQKSNYRDRALREYGSFCNRCGYKENIAALTVHHKDHNRNNNDISNLEVLCANCHFIEHYKKEE